MTQSTNHHLEAFAISRGQQVEVGKRYRRGILGSRRGYRISAILRLASIIGNLALLERTPGVGITIPEVRAAGLLRLPVLVSQREVELQHVDELLTEEPADRRLRIRFDHLLDLRANLTLIPPGVFGPGRGYAI